jgi:hypothetical protein
MKFPALGLFLIAFALPLHAVNSQMQPMEDRLARYDSNYTKCDGLDASQTNQLFAMLQLNPASDEITVKLVCSALKRVRVLKIASAKPFIRDLLDVSVDPENADYSSLPGQLRNVHYMALQAYGELADEDKDADVLYNYMKMRKLDNVGEYIVARAIGRMKKNAHAVQALNDMLENLPEMARTMADDAVIFAILDSIEKQGDRSSIAPLFRVQSQVSADRDIYNRISELVGTLSAEGN